MGSKARSTKGKTFKNPRGTRDFYPLDLLRRRYITETWRAVSIRHGFEEIDGPTFEHAELYTVKSGEGILSELFSFKREGGDELYALRPEFTPTLARMYAAQAASLPKPCRWFCIPNFFRAERPQRGRLREFCQWNCDVMGDDSAGADADVIACAVDSFEALGLYPQHLQMRLSDRDAIAGILTSEAGVPHEGVGQALALLDRRPKLTADAFEEQARMAGLNVRDFDTAVADLGAGDVGGSLMYVRRRIEQLQATQWCVIDPTVVRGLAYYTGTVFEVLAEGERAIAGGGRYDNLIELFGGPPTPACGFGMGDVVLGNLLSDHGLMPGADPPQADAGALMDAVQNVTTGALGSVSLRPDVFVVSADEEADGEVIPLVAQLRRGVESDAWRERGGKPWDADRYAIPPLHARPTDKSTRNLKKLLQDAERVRAKYCAIMHEGGRVQLKDLDKREDLAHPSKGDWSANPSEGNYLGRLFVSGDV